MKQDWKVGWKIFNNDTLAIGSLTNFIVSYKLDLHGVNSVPDQKPEVH